MFLYISRSEYKIYYLEKNTEFTDYVFYSNKQKKILKQKIKKPHSNDFNYKNREGIYYIQTST